MENKQKKIDEKILRKKEELKLLQDQRAELVKREREKAKKEKERWYAELSKQIDAALRDEIGANFRTQVTQEQVVEILLTGLRQGGITYENCSGDADC